MYRVVLSSVAVILLQSPAFAQQWAEKMFSERSHDFGPVARAAKVEHAFVINNPYKEEVHIASVRSSCGCTRPRIVKDTLKTHEKGAIIAAFNTRAFTGQRSVRVTITIDRPFYAEVQLDVKGYIRTDVVVNPGQVNFGSVAEGAGHEKKVTIEYAGRDDWKITDVRSDSPYVKTDLKEVARANGRISYELNVRLSDDAPTGYLKEQLLLETTDRRAKQFPVMIEGRIVADLSVSPSALMLGSLQPDQKITKQVVVRAKKPFKILSVQGSDPSFTFETSDEAKTVHLVPVTFTAGKEPGKFSGKIVIETDSPGRRTLELSAYGQVSSPLAGK